MRRHLTVILLLLTLAFSGCSSVNKAKQSTPTPSPTKSPAAQAPQAEPVKYGTRSQQQALKELADYLGLKVGRTWKYLGEGNEYASFTATVTHAKGNLYQIEENNGGTVLARVIALQPDGAYQILQRGEHAQGRSVLGEVKSPISQRTATKILPWPLRTNTRWTLPDGSRARLMATKLTKTVPFGRLKQVVRVQVESAQRTQGNGSVPGTDMTAAPTTLGTRSKSTVDTYYAKGIGLIERRFTMGETTVTSRLQRMTLIKK